ncbi:2-oxo acid dehydrogenase subunit E2, partial [Patescibacteria group bacterium]|nr:2-oxo acid dehydrogenase subunit E2 [Patescibacteria group bacterium]
TASAPAPAAQPAAPAPTMKKVRKYDMWGTIDHVPYQGARKAVGDLMSKSKQTAPHVTHTDMLDASALKSLRQAEKEKGNTVSYVALVMKAVARALKEHRYLNATLDDENKDIILKNYWSIAFAVDTPNGLYAPVVKRVNQKTAAEVTAEITALAQKALDRSLDPMDMKGSTFTITNVGSVGGLFFTPIINYPEVAILGMGRLHDAPIAKEGQVTVAPLIPLSLSFDHRVIDGAEGARFTAKVMELLQDPASLMEAEDKVG